MHLRIGFYPRKGWATIESERMVDGETTYQITGLSAQVTEYLSRSLNFSYVYKYSRDNIFGVELENNSWSGTLGMLHRKEIDLMISSVFLTEKKYRVFQTSIPYAVVQTSVFSSTDTGGFIHFFHFLNALGAEIWCSLLITMVISCGALVLETSATTNNWRCLFWKTDDALKFHLRGILQQSVPSNRLPTRSVIRVCAAIWILSCLVLMRGFSGELKSVLMVEKEINPVNSLSDLNDKPRLKTLMVDGEEFKSILKILDNQENGALSERLRSRMKNYPFSNADLHKPDSFRKVKSGRAVIIYTETFLQSIAAPFCPQLRGKRRLHFSEDKYLQRYLVHVAHRDVPTAVLKRIDRSIRRLDELHIFPAWEAEYRKNYSWCETSKSSTENFPLGLSHLDSVFYFGLTCYVTSAIILTFELLLFNRTRTRSRFPKGPQRPRVFKIRPLYLRDVNVYYQ